MKVYEVTSAVTELGKTTENMTYRGPLAWVGNHRIYYTCPLTNKTKSIKRSSAREFETCEDVLNYEQKTPLK